MKKRWYVQCWLKGLDALGKKQANICSKTKNRHSSCLFPVVGRDLTSDPVCKSNGGVLTEGAISEPAWNGIKQLSSSLHLDFSCKWDAMGWSAEEPTKAIPNSLPWFCSRTRRWNSTSFQAICKIRKGIFCLVLYVLPLQGSGQPG